MSKSESKQTHISRHQLWHARESADFIVEELPRGDSFRMSEILETFDDADAKEAARDRISALAQQNVLESVDKVWGTSQQMINVWQVVDECYERAAHLADGRSALLPCGHAGMSNDGDHYSCAYQFCDQEFSRSEVLSNE